MTTKVDTGNISTDYYNGTRINVKKLMTTPCYINNRSRFNGFKLRIKVTKFQWIGVPRSQRSWRFVPIIIIDGILNDPFNLTDYGYFTSVGTVICHDGNYKIHSRLG